MSNWRSGDSPKTLIVEAPSSGGDRSRGVLTVMGGQETGRVLAIPLGEEVTLGRAPGCTFHFDDASVSGVHARILRLGGEHLVIDAGSTNGSYVNDVRVTTPAQLRDGDRVRLGSSTFLRFTLVSEEEEKALRTVYDAAFRDGLTGAFNRKHLEERLDAEVAYALRHKTELSVVMLDVDHFKKVNDTYGHPGGDAVLKSAAAVLARGIRTEDVLARYGGEEFVVLARGIPVSAALFLGDRLRQAVSHAKVPWNGATLSVTVSAGAASLVCCQGRTDKATLIGVADARLYKAKQSGRNRVVGPG